MHETDHETDDEAKRSEGDEAALQERVEAALRQVRDPEVEVHVFEAGLVENIVLEDGGVTIEADLADFDPAGQQQVVGAMLQAVRSVPGVESAHVEPVKSTPDTAADRDSGTAAFDRVIAVASAKGGVGKSTVSTMLACALAGDQEVGIFDADIHGPNVPTLLDIGGPIHSDEDGQPLPIEVPGAGDLEAMSIGLMEQGAPLGWRGAMAHDAVTELFEDTAWSNTDTLILDLPPGTGDVVLTTLQEVHVDGVVVVTTPFPAAVEDTARSVELFRDNDVPVLGTVVNMGGFTCPSCGDTHDLFPDGSPMDDLQATTLAELPFSTDLQETPEPGGVPDVVEPLGEAVAEAAETAWEVAVSDSAVDIRGLAPQERKDRVRERFTGLDAGEEFVVVSDRDPSPIRAFLSTLAEAKPSAFDPFTVERATPNDWVLRTVRP
ncbi:P-loop NTPase [Haloarchaeobius amylolyticus]|uniref:P-loop NTPase n=1 Tax=Haloarchaeobius amylolyticus TaxID=1198296 RepID=UPI00226F24EB|nr:P-loop NTPase [Haloarchaeobius amylolyticus]